VGDPYTVFMDPQESLDFEKSLREDSFEGIGAEISIRDNILTIVAPLSDTPAAKAGLQPGDKVLAIDGESTANIGLDDAVQKIRGEEGTVVTLTISRKSFEQARDIDITRGYIVVKSVRVQEKEDGIYVIEITNFKNDTVELFNSAVRDIIAQDPQGIILDVRNNPGGYLDGAVEVASEWVEDGNIVLEEFGDGSKQEYKARGMARLKDIPTVVLVNIGSASASEIVAGALQDHGQAIVLGEKTFGKGSVQSLENFSDQSSIKVTVAKWLTPNGSTIQDKGIEPDIKVEMTEDDYDQVKDPQMDKAMEVLIKGPEEVKKTLEQQEDDNG
jgi:carboxyl-terminal processing protease